MAGIEQNALHGEQNNQSDESMTFSYKAKDLGKEDEKQWRWVHYIYKTWTDLTQISRVTHHSRSDDPVIYRSYALVY